MAIIETKIDDIDGSLLELDLPPYVFSLKGKFYSLDAGTSTEEQIEQAMQRFIEVAKPVESQSLRQALQPAVSSSTKRAIAVGGAYYRERGHQLADSQGRVSIAKENIVRSVGSGKLICFWCDKVISTKANKVKASDFVVSFLDKNPLNTAIATIEPAHVGCHRGWLSSSKADNSPLNELRKIKIADRLKNGPLWG